VAEKLLLHSVASCTFVSGRSGVESVRAKVTGLGVVGQVGGHDPIEDVAADVGIEDRKDHLDPAVKVAGHEVGAAEVDQGIAVVVEDVNAAVLEKAVHDAADADVFTEAGDAGAEAADASDDHVDGDTFLGGGVKGVDDLLVDERVHFDENAGLAAGAEVGALAVDHLDEAGGKIERGHKEFVEVGGFRHAGENVEKRGHFGGEGRTGGQ